jgi:hypothetical protein
VDLAPHWSKNGDHVGRLDGDQARRPLPFMDQNLKRLSKHSHFCYLDDYSGFSQIHVHKDDQEKTTFTCPFGTFSHRRMHFRLCNAPATFQRCMNAIFADYTKNIMEVFMDDFFVYGTSLIIACITLTKFCSDARTNI